MPLVTSMPRGTSAGRTVQVLMSSALLINTVHRAEPARTNMLATMAAEVDTKNAQVCLITPLSGAKKNEPRAEDRLAGSYERGKGYGCQDRAEQ